MTKAREIIPRWVEHKDDPIHGTCWGLQLTPGTDILILESRNGQDWSPSFPGGGGMDLMDAQAFFMTLMADYRELALWVSADQGIGGWGYWLSADEPRAFEDLVRASEYLGWLDDEGPPDAEIVDLPSDYTRTGADPRSGYAEKMAPREWAGRYLKEHTLPDGTGWWLADEDPRSSESAPMVLRLTGGAVLEGAEVWMESAGGMSLEQVRAVLGARGWIILPGGNL